MASHEEVLAELRDQLKDPGISDKEFDRITRRIKKLEED